MSDIASGHVHDLSRRRSAEVSPRTYGDTVYLEQSVKMASSRHEPGGVHAGFSERADGRTSVCCDKVTRACSSTHCPQMDVLNKVTIATDSLY